MDLELNGKTALVLGAGGGLGGAISEALAAEGVVVAAADIDFAAVQRTCERVASTGGKATPYKLDLGQTAEIEAVVAEIEKSLGHIDILINNTGGPPPTPVSGQDAAVWTKHFESMVLSVVRLTDSVLPGMRSRGWGRIITSTSSGVVAPIPNLGLSNALRLSLVGWSKTLAREVGGDGITANIVLPGRIATQRIAFLDEKKAEREGRPVESVKQESTASIPVGRYGTPQEYANVVTFLASPKASYVTGSVIRIDGGLIPSI